MKVVVLFQGNNCFLVLPATIKSNDLSTIKSIIEERLEKAEVKENDVITSTFVENAKDPLNLIKLVLKLKHHIGGKDSRSLYCNLFKNRDEETLKLLYQIANLTPSIRDLDMLKKIELSWIIPFAKSLQYE